MELSMWILADWLEALGPEVHIEAGERTLSGIRLGESGGTWAGIWASGSDTVLSCGPDRLHFPGKVIPAVLNRALEAFAFYGDWERKNLETIYEGGTLQTLVDDAHTVFENPVTVFGPAYTLEAASSAYPAGSLEPGWDVLLRERVNSMEIMPEIREILSGLRGTRGVQLVRRPKAGWRQLMCNLYLGREYAGFVNMREYRRTLSRGQMQLMAFFCGQIEQWKQLNQGEAPGRQTQRLLKALLEGDSPDADKLVRYLLLEGWEEDRKKTVYRLCTGTFDPYGNEMLSKKLHSILPWSHTAALEDGVGVLTAAEGERRRQMERSMGDVMKTFGYFAVRGGTSSRLEALREQYGFCRLVSALCPGEAGKIYACEDYTLDYICAQLHRSVPAGMEHPALGALRRYDSAHGTALEATLRCFLLQERNLVRTATALYIHRNSLVYRMRKIRELTGVNLNEERTRLHLLLSCLAEGAGTGGEALPGKQRNL